MILAILSCVGKYYILSYAVNNILLIMSQIVIEQKKDKMTEPYGIKSIHIPVMLKEVLEYLKPQEGNVFLDGTIGLGGHSESILEAIGEKGHLIGIDRDQNALSLAEKRLEKYKKQCNFVYGNFRDFDKISKDLGIRNLDGILLDIGVSSLQIDNPDRGFNIRAEGPLDMRMDQNAHLSAYDLVNSLSEKEIAAILWDYGQERFANRIARVLVENRHKKPIDSTRELRHLIMRAMPYKKKRQKTHPATRSFQAFRIAVNRELDALEKALDKCVDMLKPGARIGVISFHSLEDRIVKVKFRDFAKEDKLKLIVKKPLRPSDEEVDQNPRCRSARLRIAERI